jgi:hypothetical protein
MHPSSQATIGDESTGNDVSQRLSDSCELFIFDDVIEQEDTILSSFFNELIPDKLTLNGQWNKSPLFMALIHNSCQ